MAEFKISKQLSSEIAALKSSGDAINDGFSAADSTDVKSLNAACAYIREQTQIKNMLALYASLLAKDAADLAEMVKTVEAADTAASKSYSG